MKTKILIMGLPDSGKKALTDPLCTRIPAVRWNADEVRLNLNKHLTFTLKDRIQQAKSMKFLADKIVEGGRICIVDFVCPTPETREAFGVDDAFVVWCDSERKFEDTDVLFVPPENYDVHVTDEHSVDEWADIIADDFIW